MRAEDKAMQYPPEQRGIFWDGYMACVKEFETELCLEKTNGDCPYLAAKVAERMKQVVRMP